MWLFERVVMTMTTLRNAQLYKDITDVISFRSQNSRLRFTVSYRCANGGWERSGHLV